MFSLPADLVEIILDDKLINKHLETIFNEKPIASYKDWIRSLIPEIKKDYSQSISIRMGNLLHEAIKKWAENKFGICSNELFQINGECDDLLLDINNIIMYFELKLNTQFDSEKSPAVKEKIERRRNLFKELNKDYYAYVVSLIFSNKEEIKHKLGKLNKETIIGYVEFFNLLGFAVKKEDWEQLNKLLYNKFTDKIK